MSEKPFVFSSKQELLDSFTIYAMESSGMDKASAQQYAKMMCSDSPERGWYNRENGSAQKREAR